MPQENRNFLVALIVGAVILLALVYLLLQRNNDANTDANGLPGVGTTTNGQMLQNGTTTSVTSQEVAYYGTSRGFYAYPKAEGNYPGVVMIHEWWGLNDQIRGMATELAKNGYRVLAVDLYRGQVATSSDQARTLSGSINRTEALANMRAATQYLRNEGAQRVASFGWCFGGAQSLQLSLSPEELDATIIYYGQLVTDRAQLARVDGPVLGIFGATDTSIPTTTVAQFDRTLDDFNVQNQIYIYPGVGHAFANPSGMNYAPEATRDAWSKTLAFLQANLK